MKNTYKYLLLYTVFAIIAFGLFKMIDNWHDEGVNTQKNMLLKEAKTLYENQLNTRKWNSMYGGVYVKPLEDQIPNKYLQEPTLKVNEDLTLLKINPAWMSRQLSKLSKQKHYSFRITGLNPINPDNAPSEFEKRAIDQFKNNNKKEYYEFSDDGKFNYMGATKTNRTCIACHTKGTYKVGTVSGGISIKLNSGPYTKVIEYIQDKATLAKLSIIFFLSIIVFLLREQFKHNEKLSQDVDLKTAELESTKVLLQSILDADKSFVLVSDGKDIIFANKTILDFAGFTTLEDFKNKHKHISDKFEEVDDENFLKENNNGLHWIEYLIKEQDNRKLKVLVKKDDKLIYFRPHAKEININKKVLYLITFDNITHEYTTIQELETQALTDPLTKLFNRRKLDTVLKQEMEFSFITPSPLSIVFLDIDHFKIINDTLGHDVGDIILKEIASLINDTTRKSDFVARWGGEEFMISLQATDSASAYKIAEKLRLKIEGYTFTGAGKITISVGVTEFKNNESVESFTKRVDEALYEAKNAGRNKTVLK